MNKKLIDENLLVIREVKSKRPLWDQTDENYNSREITERLWLEVANNLSLSVHSAKSKWINLRCSFRKLFLKEMSNYDPENTKPKHRWKYFAPMLFLKSQLKAKISSDEASTLPNINIDKIKLDGWNKELELLESAHNEREVVSRECATNSKNIPRKEEVAHEGRSEVLQRLLSSFQADMSKLENEKAGMIDENLADEDLLFLHSLLPYLKSLDSINKLILRTKIQRLICDFVVEADDKCFHGLSGNNKQGHHEEVVSNNVTNPLVDNKDNMLKLFLYSCDDFDPDDIIESNPEPNVIIMDNQEIVRANDCIDNEELLMGSDMPEESCIWLLDIDE